MDQIEKMTCGSHAIYNLIETGKALGGKIGGHRIKTSIIQIRTDVEFKGGRTEGQTVGSVQTGELLDNGAGYRIELCDFTLIEHRKKFAGVVIDNAVRSQSTIKH